MRRAAFAILTLFSAMLVAGMGSAGPSLDIRSGAVVNNGWTGPTYDPDASQGQWFWNLGTGRPEFRTHEFYDNLTSQGGGSAGHLAISGVVTHLDLCG